MKEHTLSTAGDNGRALLALSTAVIGALAARYVWRHTRFSFRGRVVLLTGGTRGLGLAMARQLVDEGARLWLLARSSDELSEVRTELQARGRRVRTIRADIRDADTVARVVEEVVREAGHIDVLINNAGVITVAPFAHTHLEDFTESLATHFWGPLRLIRQALPYLTCDGSGRIVNVSSIGGLVGVPHLSAYVAGKFALTGLSRAAGGTPNRSRGDAGAAARVDATQIPPAPRLVLMRGFSWKEADRTL
ncbi:MAG: SDR family oxidoreductase [Acidobacteria bacterium]|nr:SDR family oxidoreductase [Acidobacteriota bacterium]